MPANTLVILGNGFDIAHGIKSSYKDYRSWLQFNNNQDLVNLIDIFFSHSRNVWNNIEQALGEYDEKKILNYCRPDEDFDYDHSLRASAGIEDSPMHIFQPALENFKESFRDWVNNIEISRIQKIYPFDSLSVYLTFNYTDTLETFYKIPESQIAHIHGYRLKNNELIIGHNNNRDTSEAWDNDDVIFEQQAQENIITWMNDFTKDYSNNINRNRIFFDNLKNIKQISIYGHSIAKVDWPYFKEVIKNINKNTSWEINCFSNEDVNNANEFVQHFKLGNVSIKK